MPIRNLLYVCTGNVFRSSVAEEITKQLLEDLNMKMNVESAGLLKYNGEPIREQVLNLTEKYRINLRHHEPRQVNKGLIKKADLILVFENSQVKELEEKFPQAKNKTYTIKGYVGQANYDVEDLRGKPIEVFEEFLKETKIDIKKCLDRMSGR